MAALFVVPLVCLYGTPVRAYSGPSAVSVAQGLRRSVEIYYRNRPIPIGAWNNRSGPPLWIESTDPESVSPQSWKVVTSRLNHNDADLMVAPEVVGRQWSEIFESEPVLVLTYPLKGRTVRREITKTGKVSALSGGVLDQRRRP